MIRNFEITFKFTADTTQNILKNLPHSVVTLLESWQQKYDKSLSKTEKSGQSYVDDYIAKLVKLAEILDSHVEKNPAAAKEVLQSVNIISQKGYPHLYIEADFDKSPNYDLAHDCGFANCDSEIDLSSTLRNTIRSVVNADSSLLNDACTVVKNMKDCSERVYFYGGDYEPAIFENTQKRNFLQWMQDKLDGKEKDLSQSELIYEKNGYFKGYKSLKYNKGCLIYRYEEFFGDPGGAGYIGVPKTRLYYLGEQERILVEKIIKTKNPDLLKNLMKVVKNDSSEMDGLAKDYLKYQQNAESKKIPENELNNSKLAKVRNKAAKLADRLTERMGLENVVKKVTGGKKIEEVKINSRVKALEKTISDAVLGSEITKEQILSHNIEKFKAHFNDGEGDIFVYPHECVKAAEDGKKHGYIYRGVYQGADLLGVKVYESENVELNEFKNIKALKNRNGKDLFSLDELVEFDYAHTQKIWKRETFHASPHKKQATKEAMEELINRRLDGSNKR